MKSLLIFLAIQIMIYLISMSDATTIGIIVFSAALVLFAGAYFSASIKDKRHKKKSIKAVFEGQ